MPINIDYPPRRIQMATRTISNYRDLLTVSFLFTKYLCGGPGCAKPLGNLPILLIRALVAI